MEKNRPTISGVMLGFIFFTLALLCGGWGIGFIGESHLDEALRLAIGIFGYFTFAFFGAVASVE